MLLSFVYLHQDAPKKSTMKKLERLGVASIVPVNDAGRKYGMKWFTGAIDPCRFI